MITVHKKLSISKSRGGRKRLETNLDDVHVKPVAGVPRIARLMALAIKYQRMLDCGEVTSITELAKLCHVTQPRMTQILNLNLLCPEIQEQLLFMPPIESGKPSIHEKGLRAVSAIDDWGTQKYEFDRRCEA